MPDSRKTILQGRRSSPIDALNEPAAGSSRYADGFDSRDGSRHRGVPFHVATGVPFVLAISIVIDIDPQCSASKWGDRRGEGSEPPVTATHAARLPRIRETCVEGGVERLIIDTPAGCGPSVIDAAKVADIAIIPTGPHQVEIETLEATIQAAKVAGAPAAVVITRAERGHVACTVQAPRMRPAGWVQSSGMRRRSVRVRFAYPA